VGAGDRLYRAALHLREDLRWVPDVFPDPDTEEFYLWVVNFGLREQRADLTALLPPIPGAERIEVISGNGDVEAFLNVGTQTTQALFALLRESGRDPFAPRRILDFGCGCARVLRHLLPLARSCELAGCDIDAAAIDFCRDSIGAARFFVNRPEPPLEVADGAFDLVYSISVFTHLGRGLQEAWVREIRRVLAPGGLAAITVHGELAWRRVWEDVEQQRTLGITSDDLARAAPGWGRDGFAFVDHIVPGAYDHREPYGLVFLRPAAMNALWSGFRLLSHRSGAISDWQDLLLLEAD